MSRILVNTREFKRVGLHFQKHEVYTDALPKTKDYEDFWDRETERCQKGYSVGGVMITGNHYFYLNYVPILRVEDKYLGTGKVITGKVSKFQGFPNFWDGDYNFFWALEIARHGVKDPYHPDRVFTEEQRLKILANLGLEVEIRNLGGGLHMVVLKSRGKGFSYKTGGILAREWCQGKNSKNYAVADDKDYLTADGVMTKAVDTMDHLDTHTVWGQPRIKDTDEHKRAGFRMNVNGAEVKKGRMNEIICVSTKNNPDKMRGKRGEYIFFEEAGKFPKLVQTWEICRSSVEQGSTVAGTMMAYGTGGTEEANFEGLETLFYDPENYGVLPFNNIWDEDGEGQLCGYFAPAYQNWQGYMDSNGNSDVGEAKAFMDGVRQKKRDARDAKALEQYTCENPYTPQEATLRSSNNLFPTAELNAQLNFINVTKRWHKMTPGILIENSTDGVDFKPATDIKPLLAYPIREAEDKYGAVCVLETPWKNSEEVIPDNLYIIAHDPYAHDDSGGDSVGAAYVLKMTNNFSHTYNDAIVASYVGRPGTQDEYNRNLFLLAKYYNAKIAFENDRGNIIQYARYKKKLKYLTEEITVDHTKELKSKNVSRGYGMHMTTRRKEQAEMYVADWLNTELSSGKDGVIKILHTIYDPGLLKELIKFNKEGNFDRVSALFIGMYYFKELAHKRIAPKKPKRVHDEFFSRQNLFAA